ncbi:hypothetical protein CDAR_474561 [Caerostris darwini]|uniref:Uncharacterized protein n=1 Tax=Caerostris darwini TaxID=1538125 RepID=A0AAV4PKK6_9ARAC|nr:hypothetical protein CDAR_474561 [Caerostris darwini]
MKKKPHKNPFPDLSIHGHRVKIENPNQTKASSQNSFSHFRFLFLSVDCEETSFESAHNGTATVLRNALCPVYQDDEACFVFVIRRGLHFERSFP